MVGGSREGIGNLGKEMLYIPLFFPLENDFSVVLTLSSRIIIDLKGLIMCQFEIYVFVLILANVY